MEEILAALVGQAGSSEGSRQTQGVDSASNHTTLSRNIPRKKSMFTLASELFKQTRPEVGKLEIDEVEQHERNRGQWNPFASLRGLKDGRKRATDILTLRGTSLSPQRNNDSGDSDYGRGKSIRTDVVDINEFCTPKTMRRKSIQDLLGTVGNKFSIARRLLYNEDMIQRLEAPADGPLITFLEASEEAHDIPPLVLPEPALPNVGESNTLPGSSYPDVVKMGPNEMLDSQNNLTCNRECGGLSLDLPSLEKKGSLSTLNGSSHVPNVIELTGISTAICNSQQPELVSPIVFPEELSLVAPPISLRGADPQETTKIKFTDMSDPPHCEDSDDFENGISSQCKNLDRLFPDRMLRRESRYKSLWDATQPENWDLLTSDVRAHIAMRVSKNSHLTDIRTRWSADSSETDTDNMSDYSWVKEEMEVRNIIDRGKEIMRLRVLSPYLHSHTVSQNHQPERSTDSAEDDTGNMLSVNETQPESPHFENPMSQFIDEAFAPDINSKSSTGKKRIISLENSERFRPRRTNSRLVSIEPVHIVYPANEFCEAQKKTYASKSSAFGDLYQNHSGYSDYCLFDRSTRTYYPQALSYFILEPPQPNDDNLEVVWLPLEMFPADLLESQVDEGDDSTTSSKTKDSASNGPSSEPSVPEACQNSNLAPMVLNKAEDMGSSSSHNKGATSCTGDEVRYVEPTLRLDIDGGNQSNYSGTLISIREVSSLSTESISSEDPELKTNVTDNPHKIAVDLAMARLHLGSQFSSTETLHLTREENNTTSFSAQSSMSHLKEAQTAESSHVKTWVEMERDFLDRFAPGSHLSQDRRGRIAVYEAFKKLRSLADMPNEEVSAESYQDYEDEFEIEHIEMAGFKEASAIFDLGDVAANSSGISEDSCESAFLDFENEIQYKGKGKESFALPHLNQKASAKADSLGHCSVDTGMGSIAVDSSLFMIGSNRNNTCQDSNILAVGEHRRLGSNESSETDDIPITMLSGYMFTHYAEQLGQLSEENSQEGQSERERDHQSIVSARPGHLTDITPNPLKRINDQALPMCTIPQIEEGMGGHKNQLSIFSENYSGDLVKATSTQVCRCPSQVDPAQLMLGHSTMNSEASSDIYFPHPCPSIQRGVLTPNKRIQTPLAEIVPQNDQTARAVSPTLSEANTEASENFGQKLERYRRIEEEEEKENDLWWTDSISYG